MQTTMFIEESYLTLHRILITPDNVVSWSRLSYCYDINETPVFHKS